jgi:transcriptional regulator with XRE-family HTH domain
MSPVIVSSIGSFVREQHEQAMLSIRQLAQIAGVSNPYLSQIERGLRKPSADLLQQIAKGLRISAEALYVQSGIGEDRPNVGVPSVVLADPDLTVRQKQVLVELYESFRKEAALAAGAEDADPAEPADLAAPAPQAEPASQAAPAPNAEPAAPPEPAAPAAHYGDAALARRVARKRKVPSRAASR